MRNIRPSKNTHKFPRRDVEAISLRPNDLVIRIADWTHLPQDCSEGEPAYDVEVYIRGVYDFDESATFSVVSESANHKKGVKQNAKHQAILFAQQKINELL